MGISGHCCCVPLSLSYERPHTVNPAHYCDVHFDLWAESGRCAKNHDLEVECHHSRHEGASASALHRKMEKEQGCKENLKKVFYRVQLDFLRLIISLIMNERKAWFFFFSLLTGKCVSWLTHSASTKFAVTQIPRRVHVISNQEIMLGHVSIAYSFIHVHESILTSGIIQCNSNVNSA